MSSNNQPPMPAHHHATPTRPCAPARPEPVPTALTQPYWDAAKQGKLAIQRCADCGFYHHPPALLCSRCASIKLAYEPVSGKGKIMTRTIMRDARVAGFEKAVPYAVIVVELDEQPGLFMIANLIGAAVEAAQPDLRVEVDFEAISGGFMLPQFKPA